MILTTIINHQLCIRFDTWVKEGTIIITDDNQYRRLINFTDSDFEIIDIPDNIHHMRVIINIGEEKIIKSLKL